MSEDEFTLGEDDLLSIDVDNANLTNFKMKIKDPSGSSSLRGDGSGDGPSSEELEQMRRDLENGTPDIYPGDAPDIKGDHTFELENLKPFVQKWGKRLVIVIGGLIGSAGITSASTLTYFQAHWIYFAIVGGAIILLVLSLALPIGIVLLGILIFNRFEIYIGKALETWTRINPNLKNFEIDFEHKGKK